MTHQPAATEERLRTYLDGNQPARERMCLAILNLDRRFSNLRPRHPKGGRDGGCDIDATYQSAEAACVAVAFKNSANDDSGQKRSIKAKFDADVRSAIINVPRPAMFVFFTNIALTAGEKAALKRVAQSVGFVDCELMDRERMRIVLDSTDGLGVRLQYLDLPLSPAEQASFFARWGDDIQSLIASRFQSVESTLARLMFLQEARGTLESIHVRFLLDKTYPSGEIGHFRAFCSFFFPKVRHGFTDVLFGQADKADRFSPHPLRGPPDPPGIAHGISGATWESRLTIKGDPYDDDTDGDFVRKKPRGRSSGIGATEISRIIISYTHSDTFDFNFEPRLNLEDLQDAMIMPMLNASLAEKIDAIEFWANGYVLLVLRKMDFQLDRSFTDFPVEGHFSDEELKDPWVRIRPSGFSSNFRLDFSEQTPRRAFAPRETDPIGSIATVGRS